MSLRKIELKPDPVAYQWNDFKVVVPFGMPVTESPLGGLILGQDELIHIYPSKTGGVPATQKVEFAPLVEDDNPALVPKHQVKILLVKRPGASEAVAVRRAKKRIRYHPHLRSRVLGVLLEYGDPMTAEDITEFIGEGSWTTSARKSAVDLVYEVLLILRHDRIVQVTTEGRRRKFYIYRPDLFHTLGERIETPNDLPSRHEIQQRIIFDNGSSRRSVRHRQLIQRQAGPRIKDPRPMHWPSELPFEVKVEEGRRVDSRYPTLRKTVMNIMANASEPMSGADIARSLPVPSPWSRHSDSNIHRNVRSLLHLLNHEGLVKSEKLERHKFDGSRGNPILHSLVSKA